MGDCADEQTEKDALASFKYMYVSILSLFFLYYFTVGGTFTPQWSVSQLSAVPAGEFLIVPGTSLDTNTTIITDREFSYESNWGPIIQRNFLKRGPGSSVD